MKGYFSQLSRSTGLNFESGDRTAPSGSATTPTASALRPGVEGVAPIEVEAVTFTTPSRSSTPAVSEETPADVASVPPRAAIVSTDEERVDVLITTAPEANITSVVYPESRTRDPKESPGEERRPAGKQPTVHFSEGPAEAAQKRPTDSESQTESNALIEVSPQPSPLESHIRVTNADSRAGEPRAHLAEGRSPVRGQRIVEQFESQFAGPEYMQGDLPERDQPRRPEAEDQLVQSINEAARPGPTMDEQRDQEAIVRKYMKEVRAWVSATPAIDERELEPDDWTEARPERREVLTFEHETGAASFPRANRTEESGVQDVSLSIGNISIVIEEPKKDASAAPAAPPSVARSHERTEREPTSLSRYYLRAW